MPFLETELIHILFGEHEEGLRSAGEQEKQHVGAQLHHLADAVFSGRGRGTARRDRCGNRLIRAYRVKIEHAA